MVLQPEAGIQADYVRGNCTLILPKLQHYIRNDPHFRSPRYEYIKNPAPQSFEVRPKENYP
jgi:hypothetical protein